MLYSETLHSLMLYGLQHALHKISLLSLNKNIFKTKKAQEQDWNGTLAAKLK